MDALDDARSFEIVDELAALMAVFISDKEFSFTVCIHPHFTVFVDVAVSVTGNGDGFRPSGDKGGDTLYYDGCPENGAVQHGANGAVGGDVYKRQAHIFHVDTDLIFPAGVDLHI